MLISTFAMYNKDNIAVAIMYIYPSIHHQNEYPGNNIETI